MKRISLKTAAATTIVASLALTPLAGIASAKRPDRHPGGDHGKGKSLKKRCLVAVKQRDHLVDQLQKKVDRNPSLTDEHEAALDAILAASNAGLEDARDEIIAATDRASLLAACNGIAEELRIISLVSPQVLITLAGDKTSAQTEDLAAFIEELAAALDALEADGLDVSEWRALLDEATAALAQIDGGVGDAVDAVLALTPEGYGPDAKETLSDAVGTIRDARDELEALDETLDDLESSLEELAADDDLDDDSDDDDSDDDDDDSDDDDDVSDT